MGQRDDVATLRRRLQRSQEQLALAANLLKLMSEADTEEELAAVAELVRVLADQLPVHRA